MVDSSYDQMDVWGFLLQDKDDAWTKPIYARDDIYEYEEIDDEDYLATVKKIRDDANTALEKYNISNDQFYAEKKSMDEDRERNDREYFPKDVMIHMELFWAAIMGRCVTKDCTGGEAMHYWEGDAAGDPDVGIPSSVPSLYCEHCETFIEFQSEKLHGMFLEWLNSEERKKS